MSSNAQDPALLEDKSKSKPDDDHTPDQNVGERIGLVPVDAEEELNLDENLNQLMVN